MTTVDFSQLEPLEHDHAQAWVELLFHVSREFSSSLDLDETLGQVLSMTVNVVGASEGSIFLLDPQGNVIRSINSRFELSPEIKVSTIETVMREGFAGWVYENRKHVIVEDTQTDPRWHDFPEDRLQTRSAIGLPLVKQEEIIGLLTLTHPAPNAFTSQHLNVLHPIADQAARAIENASLYTRTQDELAKLNAVINAVQEPILVFDEKDHLLLFNQDASKELGIKEKDMGRPADEVILDPGLLAFCNSAALEKAEVTFEDNRVFDCNIEMVDGLGKVVSLYDITTLKQLDALKSEFVSHVSHDLKNPLAIIRGYASMIPEMPEESEKFAEHILKGTDRMRDLIDNILDIGKIEMGMESEFDVVDIRNVIEEVITVMQHTAMQKKIELKSELAEDNLNITGARIRLIQAVTNLVGNALKFTPEDGIITIGARREDERHLRIYVRDTGPGIPQVLQSKLFQKFSKLGQDSTHKFEGHGLGLAIVKAVVEAHHGRVWVESEEGKGAIFIIRIPIQ